MKRTILCEGSCKGHVDPFARTEIYCGPQMGDSQEATVFFKCSEDSSHIFYYHFCADEIDFDRLNVEKMQPYKGNLSVTQIEKFMKHYKGRFWSGSRDWYTLHEQLEKKGIIDSEEIVFLKSVQRGVHVVAIVQASEWFKRAVNTCIPFIHSQKSLAVVEYADYHDGEKSNIEGKTTLAVCRDLEDADLIFKKHCDKLHM